MSEGVGSSDVVVVSVWVVSGGVDVVVPEVSSVGVSPSLPVSVAVDVPSVDVPSVGTSSEPPSSEPSSTGTI